MTLLATIERTLHSAYPLPPALLSLHHFCLPHRRRACVTLQSSTWGMEGNSRRLKENRSMAEDWYTIFDTS